ncbi:unnamed protein product [Ectocarpus sp. 4 AP-2014]
MRNIDFLLTIYRTGCCDSHDGQRGEEPVSRFKRRQELWWGGRERNQQNMISCRGTAKPPPFVPLSQEEKKKAPNVGLFQSDAGVPFDFRRNSATPRRPIERRLTTCWLPK